MYCLSNHTNPCPVVSKLWEVSVAQPELARKVSGRGQCQRGAQGKAWLDVSGSQSLLRRDLGLYDSFFGLGVEDLGLLVLVQESALLVVQQELVFLVSIGVVTEGAGAGVGAEVLQERPRHSIWPQQPSDTFWPEPEDASRKRVRSPVQGPDMPPPDGWQRATDSVDMKPYPAIKTPRAPSP